MCRPPSTWRQVPSGQVGDIASLQWSDAHPDRQGRPHPQRPLRLPRTRLRVWPCSRRPSAGPTRTSSSVYTLRRGSAGSVRCRSRLRLRLRRGKPRKWPCDFSLTLKAGRRLRCLHFRFGHLPSPSLAVMCVGCDRHSGIHSNDRESGYALLRGRDSRMCRG